jgi:hypothetical protein
MKKVHLMDKEEGQPVMITLAMVMPKGTLSLKKPGALCWIHAKCHLCCFDKCNMSSNMGINKMFVGYGKRDC